jgi:hypothetical protein
MDRRYLRHPSNFITGLTKELVAALSPIITHSMNAPSNLRTKRAGSAETGSEGTHEWHQIKGVYHQSVNHLILDCNGILRCRYHAKAD